MTAEPQPDVAAALAGARVLVTGASGFIGRRLVARLLSAGAQVHAIDLVPSGAAGVTEYLCDLRDAAATAAAVDSADPSVVFHLAAFKQRTAAPDAFADAVLDNITGTLDLVVPLCGRPGLRALVAVGTAEEYAGREPLYSESMREAPVSAYSFSKTSMVHMLQTFHRVHGLPAVVLRPTIAYGPGQGTEMFLPALIEAMMRGDRFPMTAGEQMRDFIYVDDVVEALVAAASTPSASGGIFNVGSGESVMLRHVAMRVERLAGRAGLLGLGEVPYRAGESMAYAVDISSARSVLGWSPAVGLDEGLAITVESYR
ncbi:MAG: NAD-dependent epimerase/dehydratase family protein [Coriobacteriia bacterium]|nr:NAD-dependent epimerase/dehydratase family protein [Coriobacteriia bacterium]